MKFITLFFFLLTSLFASHVESFRWKNNETYLMFLQRLGLPQRSLYYNLDKEDQKMTEDIRSGVNYQILYNDKNDEVEQILIPINDELQIHIYKDKKDSYRFETLPIISDTKTKAFTLTIEHSPSILKTAYAKGIALQ